MSRHARVGLALAALLPWIVAYDVPTDAAGTNLSRRKADPRPVLQARPSAPNTSSGPADAAREAFLRATAPGLGDSSRVHLRGFLARYGRHPLAREAWLELGTLAYALGEYAEARDDFRRARGGAVLEQARVWEARALLALGAPREARALAQPIFRARRASSTRWEAGEIVALTFTTEGKRAAALSTYRELLAGSVGTGEAAALFQAIDLAEETGAADDARSWRERLQRAFPRSPEAASARAAAPAPAATPHGGRAKS